MTDTTGYEAQGAGAGALSGAAAGSAFGPWGAAAGAVVGGVAGGIEGMGVGNRQSAQQAAEAAYQAHLTQYLSAQNTASQQFGNQAYGIGNQQTASIGTLGSAYGQIPQNVQAGAQATGQRYDAALQQALPQTQGRQGFGAIPSAQNAVGQNQAINSAYMAPITSAYQFRGGQQAANQAIAGAQNQYGQTQAQLGQQLSQGQQMYQVGALDRQLAFQKQYGQDSLSAYGAANAGSNQMLLGQLMQTGATALPRAASSYFAPENASTVLPTEAASDFTFSSPAM